MKLAYFYLFAISSLWLINCTTPNPVSNPTNIDTKITTKDTVLSIDTSVIIDLNVLLVSTELATIDLSSYNTDKAAFLLPLSFIGNNNEKTPLLVKFQNFANGKGIINANGKSS